MDKRVEKTKKKIRKALFKLLERKSLTSITVTELCDEARVNRRTFYIHYENVEAVMDEYQDELYYSVVKALEQVPQSIPSLIKTFDQNLNKYSNELRLMTLNDRSHTLIPKFKTMLVDSFSDGLSVKLTFKNRVVIGYLVTGVLEAYNIWFTEPTAENYRCLQKTNSEVMNTLTEFLAN